MGDCMANCDFLRGIGRIVVGCMILVLGPVLSTAQEVGPTSLQPTAPSTTNGNGGSAAQPQVHLDAHGNIAGQIEGLNGEATGQASAINVSFVQDGTVIASATSDGFGRFQVTGLQPGTYSVLAYGPDGVAAFSAQVLPPSLQVIPTAEGAAADSSTTLTMNLVSTPDANTLDQTGENSNTSSSTAVTGTPLDTGLPAPGGGGGNDAGGMLGALGALGALGGLGGATGGGGGGGAGAAASSIIP